MEYALRVTTPEDAPHDARAACASPLRELLPDGPTVALYFGSEFCEDRLPDLALAAAYCDVAHERGWEATLATPLVTDRGIKTIDCLLAALDASGRRVCVVFNDWGVLRLLRDRHPALPRRAGRLMNRSLRDPRTYRNAPAGTATHDASRHARTRALLASLGVAALETDVDLEGGWLGDDEDVARLSRALHVPFTYAASGRACPVKAALYPDGDGFAKALADRCPAPCRDTPMPAARADTPLRHWRAGNTLLYEAPLDAARAFVARADRVVVHASAAP
ncbi:MAG: hypothetical protein ACM3JC_15850 [Rudaea sp.]